MALLQSRHTGFIATEPSKDFRVSKKRSTVRMIRRHEHFPRISNHQRQLQANGPLSGIYSIALLVVERNYPTASFRLDIAVNPLVPAQLIERVLEWAISRHGGCVGEYELTHVKSQVIMSINVLGDFFRGRAHVAPPVTSETAKLQVSYVTHGLAVGGQIF